MGPLGISAAAIGARLAAPGRPVVALIGDGGIQFTLPELAAAVEAEAPIVVLLWNNRGYGEIRREMLEAGQPLLGVDLAAPDFAAVARAFGAHGETIDDPARLPDLLSGAFEASTPTVIDVRM